MKMKHKVKSSTYGLNSLNGRTRIRVETIRNRTVQFYCLWVWNNSSVAKSSSCRDMCVCVFYVYNIVLLLEGEFPLQSSGCWIVPHGIYQYISLMTDISAFFPILFHTLKLFCYYAWRSFIGLICAVRFLPCNGILLASVACRVSSGRTVFEK